MHKGGFPQKLFKLCRILNNEIYAKIKIGKNLASKFKVDKGLTQGDQMASLLFNIALEIAIRKSKAETWETIFEKIS
jgi:sorting nexin-29